MTTRRGRVACRFPRKDQSSAVDFFPFWNEVFSARTGQLKIWGIAFGEGFVFGVTCLSDLCHLCELCIYLASIHHESSCPFKLMESQTRTTRDMPRYGLWRKRAESLIVEQKRQLCAESRRLGISLAFALDELQGSGLREKSAEIWRTTRCNDTRQYMTIHDTWIQMNTNEHNQVIRPLWRQITIRSEIHQTQKTGPWDPIRPIRSLRIVFGESPRNAMATTWGFWDHPSRLCSQDSWAWWGDLVSQASKKCQCMHRLYMAIPDYPISRDDCSEQNSDFQWKKWFGNMMLEEKFLEVEGFPRSDMWTLVTCSLRTYSG